jgi:triosephosphate isomerase
MTAVGSTFAGPLARQKIGITPPFFEIGPKAYVFGEDVLVLARHADALARAHDVQIIITPQYVDIPPVAREMESVLVFAQHMDALEPGRGVGSVLPEAIKAAGAVGVLLNHVEKRLARPELIRTMRRAMAIGLATMVCADDDADAVTIARLGPDVIIVESPGGIASGTRRSDYRTVATTNEAIWSVDPTIRVLHGAGITSAQDVYDVVAAGAQGTGSSSAIVTAADPRRVLEEMIRSVRLAWDSAHREED